MFVTSPQAWIQGILFNAQATDHGRRLQREAQIMGTNIKGASAHLLEGGETAIDQASSLLKAMANDNRLRILCLLDGNELSVTELNQRLVLSQSALSQHLAILRRENLVATRRESQTIYYSLQGDRARTLIEALGSLPLDDMPSRP